MRKTLHYTRTNDTASHAGSFFFSIIENEYRRNGSEQDE